MDAIQLPFSDHSDRKLKSEETLFVCPLISRGNSVLHVPSVNQPYFNQYLLYKLKEKLIEAVTLLAKKENIFAQTSREKLCFRTGIGRAVTFGVSTHCIIALNSLPQKVIQFGYCLGNSETLPTL